MRIKGGYDVINADGQYIVCATDNITIRDTIYLDEISLFLWNSFKGKDFSKSEMLKLLLDNFEISTVLALSEIDKFVKILKGNGIIE